MGKIVGMGMLFAGMWLPLVAFGDFLLTDNQLAGWKSNVFSTEEKRLNTGVELKWITEGDFGCDKKIVETGSRPDGKNRVLLDGRIGPEGFCQAYSSWGGGIKWGTFVLDLHQEYLITRAAVWALSDPQRRIERLEILLSNDGRKYVSMGTAAAENKPGKTQDKLGIMTELKMEKPVLARYVMFRVKKDPGAMQMVLSEIAIWGEPAPHIADGSLRPENRRPAVGFTVTPIQNGAAALDWSSFASAADKVKQWKIYESGHPFRKISDPGVKLRLEVPSRTTRKVLYPLEPGRIYYFALAAVYEDGEYPEVKAAVCTLPPAFTCERFGDMLAINHYWGGGGSRQKGRPNGREWEQVALDLLGTTPFRETRWWRSYPEIVEKFYEHHIGVMPFPSEENFRNGLKMGIYGYSAGNEPELSGKPATVYLDRLKKMYELGRKLHPAVRISAPTCNIGNHGLEWLEKFYQLGGGKYFDVLDLHTYLGAVAEFRPPVGYPKGSPEALFERMDKVRAIMKAHGDVDKPVISTEFGYTDCNVGNPAGRITPEDKAQFLVRGLILHYVLGFKRVFVYSFWDEGNDPNYTEHAFGMVDYEMQKKPAFQAICVLGRELGNCVLEGKLSGVALPHFGYVFRDQQKKDWVSVIWDGTGRFSGEFKTAPGSIRITTMEGKTVGVQTAADGRFRVVFGPSPVYLRSASPVSLVKSVPVKEEVAAGKISITVAHPVFTVLPGHRETEVSGQLENGSAESREITVRLEDWQGKKLAEKKINVASGATSAVSFSVKATALALERYRLVMGYEDRYTTHSEQVVFYVRKLQPNNGKVNTGKIMMCGYDHPVWFISSDRTEVTVDPSQGGRILEMIDKSTGGNQINLDYDRLGSLGSVAFYFSIWDQVKSEHGFGIGRNERYEIKVIPSGLAMNAGKDGGLNIRKELTMSERGDLSLAIKVTNRSNRELPFSYYMHPEYTVGGTGDNTTDVLLFPIGKQIVSLPFWNGLGERKIDPLTAGWWAVRDLSANLELKQEFSPDRFRQPRLWFGVGCYNIEMESRASLTLVPGASWDGLLSWKLQSIKK